MNTFTSVARVTRVFACGLLLALAGSAWAQNYPNRSVRIITAQAPGGPSDNVIRALADVLTKALGQPFIVENRQGAEGLIAGEACARAPADGYTLCSADSFATFLVPLLRGKLAFDPARDFTPIMHLGFIPSGLWVNSQLPTRSADELLALVKGRPHQVNMASWGRASNPYILTRYLEKKGLFFTDVPYKSATASWQGLVGGETQATMYSVGAGLRQGDRVRLLAVNSEQRLAESPTTPTFAELGLPSVTTWFVLQAPLGVPPEIVGRLNAVLRDAVYSKPEVKEKILGANGIYAYGPAGSDLRELARYMKSQELMYADVLKTAGIGKE